MEQPLEVVYMYHININFVQVFLPNEFKIHRIQIKDSIYTDC